MTKINLEELRFDSSGLIPVVTQEVSTGEVLMLAYMNKEALEKTLETGKAHYYSRSRKTLWLKGETSGNFQEVESIHYDCDEDAILLNVKQTGVACHTGEKTCFFRRLDRWDKKTAVCASIIKDVFDIILERKKAQPDKSYVSSLYEKGIARIAQKVYEETAELISAAKKEGKKEIVHELTDLWFHTLVLLGYKDIPIEEVFDEFKKRFGVSGIEEKESRGKNEKE